MTAVQLDMFTPSRPLQSPRAGMIVSPQGAWRAHYTGARWGWCLYRATTDGWETWEPDLPFGQAYLQSRDQAEETLWAELCRHGDRPLHL